MSRRKSRILAFQSLYAIEVGNTSLEDALKFEWNAPFEDEDAEAGSERGVSSDNGAFARILVAGTVEHLQEIDDIIRTHLKTWSFERVNKVSLSILRMSIFSLKYQNDVDSSVVIDEAIHLAKEFGPDDSFKFVNAMLDNVRQIIEGKKSPKKADNKNKKKGQSKKAKT